MKVRELIEELEAHDGDAEVLIGSQAQWPFEYAVHGIIDRAEVVRAEAEADEPESTPDPDEKASDVFIVEGTQLRYGSKAMWEGSAGW